MQMLDVAGVITILFLAGVGHSAVGFGYALYATPLLLWIGVPLPNAVALVSTCALIQTTIGAGTLRAAVPWRLVLAASAVRVPSLIGGLFLLTNLVRLQSGQIRMVIGGVLCLLVAVQLLWRPRPVSSMHWGWAGLAFVSSGVIGGLCGMGGPPMVLWSMAHDWSPRKTRGFLFATAATSSPILLVLLWKTFGSSIVWSFGAGIALLPLVYLSTSIGLPIGNRMKKDRLRYMAYGILLVIGLSAVTPGLLALLK